MKRAKDTKKSKLISKKEKNQKNGKKTKKPSKLLPIINRLMPYILAVLFVVMLFTLIGGLGFSNFLYGIFGRFASYFILVFLLFHSLMWYYDTNRKICRRRVCCSIVIVFTVSIIQHIMSLSRLGELGFFYKATETNEVNKPVFIELYKLANGKFAEGSFVGGGSIGGGIAGILLSTIGKGLTIVILAVVLIFMFLQMFNITPASIFRALFKNKIDARKARKEEEKRRAMLRKKHKKFRVFDDEDEEMVAPQIDERILKAMNERDLYEDEDESEEKDDELEVERQPISTTPHKMPVQRSASAFRPAPPIVTVDTSDDEDEDEDEGFVLNAPSDSYDEIQEDITPDFVPYEEEEDASYKEEPQADTYTPIQEYEDEENDEDEYDAPIFESAAPIIEEKKEEKRGIFDLVREKPQAPDPKPEVVVEEKKEAPKPPKKKKKHVFPPIDIFERKEDFADQEAVNEELQEKARIIVDTLKSFNLNTRITDVSRGPTVTRYELMPEAGVKVRSIANLQDDIALYLAAEGIRMECPIPGKSAVGIEVPNRITSMVYLRSLLEDSKFKQAKSPVTCAVGKSVEGENVYVDIAKLVHLLVAGATGQGKSVCINALLVSLLYKASPDDLRLILIDPKRVEFAPYNGIPHLLVPVVTDVKKSVGTLQWSVSEMERRFELLEGAGVRDIGEFNDRVERGIIEDEKLPRIVIVIDELYDLKMQVPEIDDYIIRLTQKARAAGIHVIIGTQRPSVDVITGVIKANIPSRIAFRVPAQVDSRTILDEVGAEKLVARGDMLLKPVGALKPIRVQGAFITEDEREMVTNFLKENSSENYDENVINQIESNTAKLQKAEKKADLDAEGGEGGGSDLDEKFYAALELAVDMGKISSSYLQRKLNLGFQRAARIIDQMEELGYIGEPNGSKPRDVLITKQDFQELMMRNEEV